MRTVDELIEQIPTDVAARPLWRYEAELLANEVTRLRAELAAEKERMAKYIVWREALTVDAVSNETQRCAKIADDWLDYDNPPFTPNNVASQIRASNAAPPHVEECYRCGGKPIEHCSTCDAEGAPHVEPSAAESEREPCAFCGGAAGSGLSWNGFGLSGNEKSIKEVERLMFCESRLEACVRELLQRREEATAQRATEARMLELARKFNENTEGDRVWWGGELADEVLKTFGEKK